MTQKILQQSHDLCHRWEQMVLCRVTGSNWRMESIQAQHTVLFLAVEKKKKSFVDSNKKTSIAVDAPSLFTGGPPPPLLSPFCG